MLAVFPALVPVAIPALAIGLAGATIYVVCLGLHGFWIRSFGHLFLWLANKRISFGRLGSYHPLRFLESVSNDVANRLLRRAEQGQALMGYALHAVAQVTEWMARETEAIAGDVLHWATWLQRSHLPKWVKALVYATFPPALLARLARAAVDARMPNLGRIGKVKWRGLSRKQIAAMIAAAVGVVAGRIPRIRPFPRIRQAEVDLSGIRKRLGKLEKAAGAVATVGLVATALSRLGLNWIRCRRVSRVGKAVCGMDSQLLGALLADATLIIGTISLVELTRGTQRMMPAITDATGYLVREAPGAWTDQPRDVIADALALFPDFPG